MSDKPVSYASDRKYSASHEWAKKEGNLVVVGISDYAQNQLGDVVFVELPPVGTDIQAGKAFCTVESVKAASDVFAPVSGTVTATNEELANKPALVNEDPFGTGWFVKIKPSNPADFDQLMDAATYQKKIETNEIH